LKPFLQKAASNVAIGHVLIFLFTLLSLAFILSVNFTPVMNLRVGDVSPRDIEAPRTLELDNPQATKEAKQKAYESVGPIYTLDMTVMEKSTNMQARTFELIARMQKARKNGQSDQGLRERLPLDISEESLKVLLETDSATLNQLELVTSQLVFEIMKKGIKSDSLASAQQELKGRVRSQLLPGPYKQAIAEIGTRCLSPDLVIDHQAIIREQQKRMAAVEPVRMSIPKGQVIIRKGDMVTPLHVDILQNFGIYQPAKNITNIVGTLLFVIVLMVMVIIYLSQSRSRTCCTDRELFLVVLIVISVAALSRWLINLQGSGYLAPVAIASMLIAILLDYRLAFLVTALLATVVGLLGGGYQYSTVALVTGFAAVLSVSRVSKRGDLIIASFAVLVTNAFMVFIMGLLQNEDWLSLGYNTLYRGGLNGVISSVAAIGILPFLENFFGITTHIRLLELSNPAEPLLQKLLVEAPGTYHHSILVGNLAEQAANAIGANSLLARVGAYYHDIGKLKRAYFFVENQVGPENPHDRLVPTLSTLIIISHIKDGLELARQFRLPSMLQDVIAQHHGTSLVAYFYHQAKLRSPDQAVEGHFRYHGPKPKTREAAIVMIADSLEAACRSLVKPDPGKIESLVKQMINDMREDGQLDECELSFSDLSTVTTTFIRVLVRTYHARVEYPEKILQEVAGQKSRKVLPLEKRA
jgi:putative nucleotidyltransferase with HDIG domain